MVADGRFGGGADGWKSTISLQIMVGRRGAEPLTSDVQRRRSPN